MLKKKKKMIFNFHQKIIKYVISLPLIHIISNFDYKFGFLFIEFKKILIFKFLKTND